MNEYDLLAQILSQFAPYIVTLAIGVVGGWAIVKKKISAIRKLIDSVDDAVQDDALSEAEFKDIWRNAHTLIKS